MKIEKLGDGGIIALEVSGIEGDMGEENTLSLIQQVDGGVIIRIENGRGTMAMEFGTLVGGGRRPVIARKLRELIAALIEEEE